MEKNRRWLISYNVWRICNQQDSACRLDICLSPGSLTLPRPKLSKENNIIKIYNFGTTTLLESSKNTMLNIPSINAEM